MFKITVFVGMVLFLGITLCFAQGEQDSITITTYYPSPYGVYRELRLHPTDPATVTCDANNEGAMFYNNNLEQVMVCRQTGTFPDTYDWGQLGGGYWMQTGSDLYPNDPGWNVGIGTSNPGAELEVAGQVKITGGSPDVGRVLTSDEEGLASWEPPVQGQYVGATASTYNGREVGGYAGGDAKCNNAFPNSRMCWAGDFVNSTPNASGWYSTFTTHLWPSGPTWQWQRTDDCFGWMDNDATLWGHWWNYSAPWVNAPSQQNCSVRWRILCCK